MSTNGQTTENQRLALEAVAAQRGWTVVATYDDNGVSGVKPSFLLQKPMSCWKDSRTDENSLQT